MARVGEARQSEVQRGCWQGSGQGMRSRGTSAARSAARATHQAVALEGDPGQGVRHHVGPETTVLWHSGQAAGGAARVVEGRLELLERAHPFLDRALGHGADDGLDDRVVAADLPDDGQLLAEGLVRAHGTHKRVGGHKQRV